ncbi:hypothetical protein EAH87_14145 [Sphingomonas koreensis]|nr:hypothetical protein EAH87_14145 [Sphingomonas koreensis]
MARGRNPDRDLPWGWWLRADANGFLDDQGRRWPSVRDAYWQGELGFPAVHFAPEQHELLLRVLTTLGTRWIGSGENRNDLFGGDHMFWRLYMCFLTSIGLLDVSDGHEIRPSFASPLEAGLSDLGRSVMLMLQATREPEWIALPMDQVLDAVRAAARGEAGISREATLRSFEQSLGRRRHLFARERVHRNHLVTLTSLVADARMPTFRITWSQSFADEQVRDDLFVWMAQRVDRWDDWGEIAYRKGAAALNEHLLTLVLAERH